MTSDPAPPQPSPPPALPEIANRWCLCILALFVLIILGDVLFLHPGTVLSDRNMDLALFFVHWRYFGFEQLKAGHLALWNPHFYCGAPFFGNFQSALLYPPNALYLVAPLAAAINWSIALNVFLGGVFMFYWARHRGLHSLAALLSAAMFMFCGPHFLQIRAGHLPNLCTLIWAPLLFLSIDQWLDRPALAPCLLGMFAVAMSVFAGHPQYVFYLGVAAAIYSLLNLAQTPRRGRALLGLMAMAAGGFALCAIQLLTGLDEGRESMRSVGLDYRFASSFSFPWENLLTLVAPWCFGDAQTHPYCGRWFITEVSLFVSVMGLVLAVCGMVRGTRAARRFSTTLFVITLVLALGNYTPLFRVLYHYAPGFSHFRGIDKFIWLSALFLSMLAGVGLDHLLRNRDTPRWLAPSVAVAGIAICALSFVPRQTDWWTTLLNKIPINEMPFLDESARRQPDFFTRTGDWCAESLVRGAVSLWLAALMVMLARTRRGLACGGMLLLTAIELGLFAHASLMSFALYPPYPAGMLAFLRQHPGDYRIQCQNPNSAMTVGTYDIGGADPSGLLRYARYGTAMEGYDFDKMPIYGLAKLRDTSSVRMLRCRYLISENHGVYATVPGILPHVLLVDRFRVMTNYHKIIATLLQTNFPVDKEVILESQPNPAPQAGADKGSAKLLDSSTDDLTVEADTPVPALLLITDAYSVSWRARGLPGSAQDHYEVMPADYCLRGIPLAAGHHLIRLEYSPLGYRVGKVISIIAWLIFLPLAAWVVKLKVPVQPQA